MGSEPYNILYLDNSSAIGGGQRSLLLLLKHLDKAKFHPFLGCPGDSLLAAETRKAGHAVIPIHLPQQHDKQDKIQRFTAQDLSRDLRQFHVILELLEIIRTHEIDLIHANSLATALVSGVAARLSGVGVIMHKRYATSYGVLDRVCEKLLDKVILVSEAARWKFASEEKQALIYNGIELDAFGASPNEINAIRAELNLDSESLFIGVVTRITPEKGVHLLVEAIAMLKRLPQVKLLVVGGPYFSEDVAYIERLKAQAKRLGVADKVIFTGFLPDTRAITALLDIALLASTIPEACPRAVIEAMAASKPIIATALGGTTELVAPETGILVPPEDSAALASAIEQLALDAALRKRMGENGRARVERLFSVEKNTRLTEEIYLHLLMDRA